METFITFISFIFIIGLISVPILLFIGIKKWYKQKFDFIAYLFSGTILTAVFIFAFAWWTDYSNQLLMRHYRYDFYAMNDIERFANVDSQNLENVKKLEFEYLGIGWPLKAMMAFVYHLPYLVVVYLVGHLIGRAKRRKVDTS